MQYYNHIKCQVYKHTHYIQTKPEVIPGRFSVIPDENNAAVSLDWSNSFSLNGILYHFNVARNNITLIQSPVTRYDFTNQPTGIRKFFALFLFLPLNIVIIMVIYMIIFIGQTSMVIIEVAINFYRNACVYGLNLD